MSWAEAKKITMDVTDIINANCKIIGSTTDIMKALDFQNKSTANNPLKVEKDGTVLFHFLTKNSKTSGSNAQVTYSIYESGTQIKSVTQEIPTPTTITPKETNVSVNVTAGKEYYVMWSVASGTSAGYINVSGDIRGKVVNFAFYE